MLFDCTKLNKIYTFTASQECIEGLANGTLKIDGSVVRKLNGQVFKELIPTDLSEVINRVTQVTDMAAGFSGVGAVSSIIGNVQNVQISNKLKKMDLKLDDILNTVNSVSSKIDSLASLTKLNSVIGIANFGVTLIAYADINRRIKEIDDKLSIIIKSIDDLMKLQKDIVDSEIQNNLEQWNTHVNKIKYYLCAEDSKIDDSGIRNELIECNSFIIKLVNLFVKSNSIQLSVAHIAEISSLYFYLMNMYCCNHIGESREINYLRNELLIPVYKTLTDNKMLKALVDYFETEAELRGVLLTNYQLNCAVLNYDLIMTNYATQVSTQLYLTDKYNIEEYSKLCNMIENKEICMLELQ